MNPDQTYALKGSAPPANSNQLDGLTIGLVLVGVAAGVGIAIAVNQLGTLAVLALIPLFLFAITIFSPMVGLLALIVVTYTQLSNVLIANYDLPSIAQPLAALLILAVIIRVALLGDRPSGVMTAVALLVAYGFIGMLSLVYADDFEAARTAFFSYAKDAIIVLIVVVLMQRPGPISLNLAVWALLIAGMFMGTISVYQELTGTYSNIYWGFGGILQQVSGELSRMRLTGPFASPNAYSQVMVVLVPLALDRLWHERNQILRLLALYALVVTVMAIFFTYSRGGFLTMLFAVGLLVLLRRPSIAPLFLTGVIVVIMFQFVPASYISRIETLLQFAPAQSTTVVDPSFRGRLSENQAAVQMFRDHPILGVGLNNYRLYYQRYSRGLGLDPRRASRSAASLYLEVLSEQGLVGIAIFLALMFLVLRGLYRSRQQFLEAGYPDQENIVTALLVGLSAYLFAALFKNSAYSNAFWLLIGMSIAAIQIAQDVLTKKKDELARVGGEPGSGA